MKCKTPSLIKTPDGFQRLVSCGHCVHCWINRQLAWTIRIMLEASDSVSSSFVTLTYADHLRPGTLDYSHITQFLRRYRRIIRRPVRYFCVGEYGKQSGREHWHMMLFGIGPLSITEPLTRLWSENGEPLGYTLAGTVTPASARYVAKYCLKTGPNPAANVVHMSRRPGIGLVQMERIGQYLGEREPRLDTMPSAWRIGRTLHPLDKSSREAVLRGYEKAGGVIRRKPSILRADFESRVYAFVTDPDAALKQQVLSFEAIDRQESSYAL